MTLQDYVIMDLMTLWKDAPHCDGGNMYLWKKASYDFMEEGFLDIVAVLRAIGIVVVNLSRDLT